MLTDTVTEKRGNWLKRHLLRLSVVAVWLALVGWLLRYEAFPDWFTHAIAGYSRLVSKDVFVDESWMRVLFQGRPIGYSRTSTERDEANPVHNTTMYNEVHLRLSLLGSSQDLRVDSQANLDVLSRLQDFSFEFWSRDYRMRVKGVRRVGNRFRVSIKTGGQLRAMELEIPDDVVVYSPMVQMALTRLRPGQTYSLKTLDPLTMATAPLAIRALRTEPLTIGTNSWPETTVLELRHRDVTILSWIDRAGHTLKQETPFGWSLESCGFDEAMDALRDTGGDDLAQAMAVPCDGTIQHPDKAEWLRLRLTGTDMSDWVFPSSRVVVESVGASGTVVKVLSGRLAPLPPASAFDPAPYLAATPFVQSDDRLIRAQASKVAGAARDPIEKTSLLLAWVHDSVRSDIAVTIPSALDVLKTMRGDCNEHTVLFTALARSLGIPARMLAGVVYKDGSYFYHAWPAVWLDGWVELDPTWGQLRVDASHLPLVEGELADQVRLVRVMGRLRIEVIEEGAVKP